MLRRSSVGWVVLLDNQPAAFFGHVQSGFGFGSGVEQVGGFVGALHRAARAGELNRRTAAIEGHIFYCCHFVIFHTNTFSCSTGLCKHYFNLFYDCLQVID